MAAILFKWMLVSWMSWMHPFYVGVNEVQHNKTDQTLEISIKLFIDDFERGLSAQYKTTVDLTNPKDPKQTDAWIFQYIQKLLRHQLALGQLNTLCRTLQALALCLAHLSQCFSVI